MPVEKSFSVLFFAQGGGFLSAKANLVEKLSHIRGIKDGQSWMTRIILVCAGDGDLGRIIESRPEGRFLSIDRDESIRYQLHGLRQVAMICCLLN